MSADVQGQGLLKSVRPQVEDAGRAAVKNLTAIMYEKLVLREKGRIMRKLTRRKSSLCVVPAVMALVFAGWCADITRAGQEASSPRPAPGKPLAWVCFESGPEEYRGTPYWWLGKYELTCTIDVKPSAGHALDLLWGSKGDSRGALVTVNGERAKVTCGGYEGFRWLRIRLPEDIGGKRYRVSLNRAGGHEAFLAALRLTDIGKKESQPAKMEEAAHRATLETAASRGYEAQEGGLYAPAHPPILKIWQGRDTLIAPSAQRVNSGSSRPVFTWPAERQGACQPSFEKAATSARIAGYSLSKVHRWLHEKALPSIDEDTGLYKVRGKWDYSDTAADCYPFLTWAAWATDREALNGPVRSILHAEQKLCNTADRIPAPYDFENDRARSADYGDLVFGASEYVKDGLIPIVELTGKDEWYERMKGIEEDLWKHASVETEFGNIPSRDIEVNGEQLQVLPRLYRMSGEEKFLTWAQRLADYYLKDENFVPHRLRDHGCEIIGGLGLLVSIESEVAPERARERLPRLRKMYDEILERGTNEDGVMYNTLGQEGGQLSDGWGYNYVGYLCWDMAAGESAYQAQVARVLGGLSRPKYSNYRWEGSSIDGFADSIEGAIYCVNRVRVAEGLEWIDREAMKNLIPPAPLTLGGRELWGLMKLHANGVRTVIMHALMHTRGCLALPWQQGLELGASPHGETLAVVLRSENEWSGRLVFDIPRHRQYLGFRRDWPRMNAMPEWFTVQLDKTYSVRNMKDDTETTLSGEKLHRGKKIHLEPGEELRLTVTPQE